MIDDLDDLDEPAPITRPVRNSRTASERGLFL